MPEVRISLSEAAKQKQQKLQEALNQTKNTDKKEADGSYSPHHKSRYFWFLVQIRPQNLQNVLEFHGEYISHQTNKPKARSFTTMREIKESLYIFGGMSDVKLNDIWVCDVKSKD